MANVTAGPVGPSDGLTVGAMVQLAGGAVSIALVAGLCVWGAKLAMRDVSGLPVVRAQAGDMRMLPEDPGGEIAANAGLTINTLVEQGAAAATESQVQLAPGGPDAVQSDLDVIPASPQPEGVLIAATGPSPAAVPAVATAPLPPETPVASAEATAEATLEALIADAAPLSALAPATGGSPLRAAVAKPAVARAPLPARRPAGLRRAAKPSDPVAAAVQQAVAGNTDLLTTSLDPGTRLAQFGVFDSAEAAAAYWTRLTGRFDSYLAGKARVIQKAQNTGGAFYRLRASGFADLGETRRLCAALQASGQDCIPVVVR